MHAIGRAFGSYTPVTTNDDGRMHPVGYWYWRANDDATELTPPSIDVVHTVTGVVVRCTNRARACGAQVANALNRAYGYTHAPRFDERTGDALDGVL